MDTQLGKLVEWNDERGYGFIAPVDAAAVANLAATALFVHLLPWRLDPNRRTTLHQAPCGSTTTAVP